MIPWNRITLTSHNKKRYNVLHPHVDELNIFSDLSVTNFIAISDNELSLRTKYWILSWKKINNLIVWFRFSLSIENMTNTMKSQFVYKVLNVCMPEDVITSCLLHTIITCNFGKSLKWGSAFEMSLCVWLFYQCICVQCTMILKEVFFSTFISLFIL